MREENGGLILGPYEVGAPVCYFDGPGEDSEYELFQEDLERLMPHIESAIARVPAFAEVGVKKSIMARLLIHLMEARLSALHGICRISG